MPAGHRTRGQLDWQRGGGGRYVSAMSGGLELILSTVLAAGPAALAWVPPHQQRRHAADDPVAANIEGIPHVAFECVGASGRLDVVMVCSSPDPVSEGHLRGGQEADGVAAPDLGQQPGHRMQSGVGVCEGERLIVGRGRGRFEGERGASVGIQGMQESQGGQAGLDIVVGSSVHGLLGLSGRVHGNRRPRSMGRFCSSDAPSCSVKCASDDAGIKEKAAE